MDINQKVTLFPLFPRHSATEKRGTGLEVCSDSLDSVGSSLRRSHKDKKCYYRMMYKMKRKNEYFSTRNP